MSVIDKTSSVYLVPTARRIDVGFIEQSYILDVARTGNLADGNTYDLIEVPDGYAAVGGDFVVITAFASGTTLQFLLEEAASGAIAVANLALGDVVNLDFGAADGTTVAGAYRPSGTAAKHVSVAAVGTFDAGKGLLTVRFRDVAAALEQVG
jgi:hypothetical protein